MLIKVTATPDIESLLIQGESKNMSDKALDMLRHFNEIFINVEVDPETGLVNYVEIIEHYIKGK